MTMTKRQKFIYRFKQCINMLDKAIGYLDEVNIYLKDSSYHKVSKNVLKKLKFQKSRLFTMLSVVDKKYIKYLNKRDEVV